MARHPARGIISGSSCQYGSDCTLTVIVTADSNQGMVDIHDRRPLVLYPDAVREWLSNETRSERAEEIIYHGVLPESAFAWHPVSRAVGNIRNYGENLIARIENPEI
ncbi:SOS response-associated peptidase family protein [Pantoea cypripedii]|uniref:SOS response-associated peptidase family protein n=1 Tax=Pantoea cypripedii TaxID=55209 RepID=UPI003F6E158D